MVIDEYYQNQDIAPVKTLVDQLCDDQMVADTLILSIMTTTRGYMIHEWSTVSQWRLDFLSQNVDELVM